MRTKSFLNLIRLNLDISIPLLLMFPLYAILYKIYIPRVNAFGCFDDCFNYLGGYFIANGKHIYSDFFFNHQPIPAFLSFIIQTATSTINIFELLLRHRQFLLLFGFLFNAFLIIRFRFAAVVFVLIYELSKFYVFGDRFLAEAIIVYPSVYLAGVLLEKLTKRKLQSIDYYLAPVFTWFIIFSREPYIPLALFLFVMILWTPPGGALPRRGKFDKIRKISVMIFGSLCLLTLFYIFDLKEYFFNVVTFNQVAVLPFDINVKMFGPKLLQIFFYPIYIFFYGGWNILKQLLIGLAIVFLIYVALLIRDRRFKQVLLILSVLALANLRIVLPGALFYESFHMIIWYGLFIFITGFLIFTYANNKMLKIFSLTILSLFLFSLVSSRSYFANEKIDEHQEFFGNFGEILQMGEVARILSNKNDSLFLDRSDDLIYWQAKRLSSYRYTWYTSQMNHFSKYTDARLEMFKTNPPDFYKEFGTCPKKTEIPDASLPSFVKNDYVRLYNLDSPSCLFVRKEKLKEISDEQWQKAKDFLYHLPRTTMP